MNEHLKLNNDKIYLKGSFFSIENEIKDLQKLENKKFNEDDFSFITNTFIENSVFEEDSLQQFDFNKNSSQNNFISGIISEVEFDSNNIFSNNEIKGTKFLNMRNVGQTKNLKNKKIKENLKSLQILKNIVSLTKSKFINEINSDSNNKTQIKNEDPQTIIIEAENRFEEDTELNTTITTHEPTIENINNNNIEKVQQDLHRRTLSNFDLAKQYFSTRTTKK